MRIASKREFPLRGQPWARFDWLRFAGPATLLTVASCSGASFEGAFTGKGDSPIVDASAPGRPATDADAPRADARATDALAGETGPLGDSGGADALGDSRTGSSGAESPESGASDSGESSPETGVDGWGGSSSGSSSGGSSSSGGGGPPCTKDGQCGSNYVCRIPVGSTTYQCVPPDSEYLCTADSQCVTSYVCRIPVGSTIRQCVPDASNYQCTSNNDCDQSRSCVNGVCV